MDKRKYETKTLIEEYRNLSKLEEWRFSENAYELKDGSKISVLLTFKYSPSIGGAIPFTIGAFLLSYKMLFWFETIWLADIFCSSLEETSKFYIPYLFLRILP